MIWEAQRHAERHARSSGASFVICDTGPEVIRIWSEVRYGRCAASVRSACREVQYDLTLLCTPDLPWTYDPLREHPDVAARWALFARYQRMVPGAVEVRGSNRVAQALHALADHTGSIPRPLPYSHY